MSFSGKMFMVRTVPEFWICPMISPLVPVCVVAVVSVLWMAQTKSDEPGKAPVPAADPMLGKKLAEVRDDNELKMKLEWCPPGFVTMEQVDTVDEPVKTDDEDEAAPLALVSVRYFAVSSSSHVSKSSRPLRIDKAASVLREAR
jgi:hypothetical protein